MKKMGKKILSFSLSLIMVLCIFPMSVLAEFDYAHNEAESSDKYYNIISKTDWDIAPGITETEIVLNNEEGNARQVIHLMEADMSNEYTRVISSYTNMDTSKYAISTIPEHAAFIENEWGENVVGAMNTCLSWYNSSAYVADPSRVNEPLGFMMVDGEVYFDHSVGFPTCIVIHKDTNDAGEARPSDIPKVEMRTVTDKNSLNGWEDQVIPCSSGYIVKDGKNQYKAAHRNDDAARSVVGVKADGTIVIMMNDGRQPPFSLGMNMYECAEVMISAGCVYAANCDGGGSSTFMSQRPGEELKVNCSPCDGSLRQNTHGIIFISTAPATGEFSSAYITTENDYYVPNSIVDINVIGRDFSGATAEVPADAELVLADDSFGAISDGKFISNGKTGDVQFLLNYNGQTVGSKTIHVVNPEVISFGQSSTVIPYGKSISLKISATYGVFDVSYTEDDFTFTLSDSQAGTLNGMEFNATSDTTKTGTVITATYKHASMESIALDVKFGKGSEILYDFEDGDISEWLGKDAMVEWAKENNPNSPVLDSNPLAGNFSPASDTETFLSTATNGKVKNGKYALGVELDYINSASYGQWAYNMFFNVGGQKALRDVAAGKNATRLGMWIYIPEELAPGHNLAMQTELYCGSSSTNYARKNTHLILECNGKTLTSCTEADIPEDRWVYCYMDLTPYNYVAIQNPYESTAQRREPQFIRFYTQAKEPFKGVLYIDDITLDYSDAVDDRIAPIISNLTINTSGTNIRSFNATINDFVASNTSGLDYTSAKIYVDGVALSGVTASGTTMGSADVTLTAGKHTVTFEISDILGNIKKESQTFTVEGTSPVVVGGHNDKNNTPKYDSVYYLDIDVENITNIDTITMDVQLNHANTWELDHMIVAAGFEAKYSFNKNHNIASITVKKVGDADETVKTLVSVPVRVWSYDAERSGVAKEDFGANSYPLVVIKANVCKGAITFVGGENGTFGGSINVATTMTTSVLPSAWHTHTAEAVDDKANTCTENGFEGRTYCDVCGSIVDWGTTIVATGHDYELVDGVMKCTCGDLFNGELNGVTYVDGVAINGWFGEEYYMDGVKLYGVHIIDGKYYNFGENGVCSGKYPMTAEWWTNEKGESFYLNAGVPTAQYALINSVPTYFSKEGVAFQGEIEINGEICVFEKGVFVESTTADVILAGRVGPDALFVFYADGTFVLCGEGGTYDFVSVGTATLPKLSWKNRPWGKNTDLSNGIKKIIIGNGITYIGDYLFYQCYNVEAIEFEENSNLVEIGRVPFNYLPKLKEVTLPESLRTIGNQAFGYNAKLEKVVVPQKIAYIQYNAFSNSGKVVLDVVKGTYAEEFAEKNNVPYTTRAFVEGLVAEGTFGDNLTWSFFESGKLVIGGTGAMPDFNGRNDQPWAEYRDDVTSIVIGKDITYLGKYAFAYAYSVKAVTFEEGSKLERIGPAALYYLSALTEITLPETVVRIDNLGLAYNGKLASVYVPQKIAYIQYNAFNNSSKVVLNVAEGTYAEEFAEKNNIAYTTRAFVEGVIAEGTFGDNLTWSFLESGKLVIGGTGAMPDFNGRNDQPWAEYRDDVTSIVIGKDITYLGKYAFAYAYSVKAVTFEEGSKLERIGPAALYYLSALTEITLPETVVRIDNLGLAYNGKLASVYVPQKIAYIQYNAFTNSSKVVLNVAEGTYAEEFAEKNNIAYTTRAFVEGVIAEGTFGDNLTWTLFESGKLVIGGTGAMPDFNGRNDQPWAEYRDDVTSIVIGKDITSLGKYAFAYAYSVKSVTFEEGSKLEKIGAAALYYLSALTEITLPETVVRIDNLGLAYNGKLASVYVPAGIEYIQYNAFNNSNNVVLNVVEGSYAETFAVKYDLDYTKR